MQLGVFEKYKFTRDVNQLLTAITEVNPNAHVIFSGLVPRPVDDVRSRNRVHQMSSIMVQEVNRCRGVDNWNCGFVNIMDEFLDEFGEIKEVEHNFVDRLYLSTDGTRVARAAWLRHLGFFPKKSQQY